MDLIIIVVLVVLLLGGGGYYGWVGRTGGYSMWPAGLVGLLVVVLLVWLLFGHAHAAPLR